MQKGLFAEDYSYDVIGRDAGVYKGQILCGMEDRRGFIWLGTENGLFRYDGKESVSFRHDYSNLESLADNRVAHIVEDLEGFIWASNENGSISRLNYITGKFSHYRLYQTEKEMASIVTMRPFVDSAGTVWYSGFQRTTMEWFLAYHDSKADSLVFYDFHDELVDSLYRLRASNPQFLPGIGGDIIINDIEFGKSERLKAEFGDGGYYRLLVINPVKKTNKFLSNQENFYFYHNINNDGKGNILLEVYDEKFKIGLYKLNLRNYELSPSEYDYDRKWLNESIMFLPYYFDDQMFFHVKTDDGIDGKHNDLTGFYRVGTSNYFEFSEKGKIHSKTRISRAKTFFWKTKFFGPTNNIIWDLYSNELIKIYPQDKKVKTVSIPEKDAGSDKTITTVFQDSEDQVWLGSLRGLYKYGEDGDFKRYIYPFRNIVNRKNRIRAIAEEDENTLIIGTDNGILYFDKTSETFTDYNESNSLEPFNEILLNSYIRSLLNDDQTLWMGTLYGLIRHEKITNSVKVFGAGKSDESSLSSYIITCIYKDRKDNIWVGTKNGLNRYLPDIDGFKIYRNEAGNETSLCGNEITSICEDNDGTLWIASYGYGLNKYNPGNDDFTVINMADGLPCHEIKSVVCDKNNDLWLGTTDGLIRYNTNIGDFTVFNKDDGFQGDEYSVSAAVLTSDNKLILGGINGFSLFSPDEINLNTNIPEIAITKFYLNDSLISYYIENGDTINKSWNSDYIKLHFAALDYIAPELNRYAFMIEGIHEGWIDIGNQNSVILAGIDPGNYVLRIKASNNDGIWNEEGISIFVNIIPPFWMTAWFRFSAILSASGLIGIVLFIRIREKKHKEETKRRLLVSQLKALQSQMNPHFIFNSLNSILNLIIQKENELSMQYLTKFSKLLRNILENSRNLCVKLSDEIDYLEMYLELEALRFENKFDYRINVDDGIDTGDTQVPTLLIQPYIENSIRHGRVYTIENGLIIVNFKKENDYLICEIIDNGIGREEAIIKKSKAKYLHKSLGMTVNRERLDLLQSEVEIEDMKNADGSSAGTKVKLLLNLKTDLLNE